MKKAMLALLLWFAVLSVRGQYLSELRGFHNDYITHVTLNAQGDVALSGDNLIFIDTVSGSQWSYDYGFGGLLPSAGGYFVGSLNNSGLVKFDATGSVSWSKTYTGFFLRDLYQSEQGDIIGIGQNATYNGVALSLFDQDGEPMNVLSEEPNPGYSLLYYGLAPRAGGGFYLVSTLFSATESVGRISFLNNSFGHVWTKTTNPEDGIQFSDVVQQVDGSAVLVGTQPNGVNEVDAIVMNIDSTGNVLWSKGFGSHDRDQIYDLAVFDDGEILIAGETAINADGDGMNECWCEDELTTDRCPNAFYMLLSADGDIEWTHVYGATGCELAVSVKTDGDDFILSGHARELGAGFYSTLLKRSRDAYQLCTGEDVQMPSTIDLPLLNDSALVLSTVTTTSNAGPTPQAGTVSESLNACPILSVPEEAAAKSPLSIYPNPAVESIHLSQKVEEVRVYDVLGNLVLATSQPIEVIDIGHLAPASYVVHVRWKGESYVRRLMKR